MSKNKLTIATMVFLIASYFFSATVSAQLVADGFDFPMCPPTATPASDGDGCKLDRSFRESRHLGEDWNGEGGGNTDFGDPVYAIGNGIIVSAKDEGPEWGLVLIVEHALQSGERVRSMYAHLKRFEKTSGTVTRGEKIGEVGRGHFYGYDSSGIPIYDYYAHLHFEIRSDTSIGLGPGYSSNATGWLNPSLFINGNRPRTSGTIRGSVAGTVTSVSTEGGASVPGGIRAGNAISITFEYESTTPPFDIYDGPDATAALYIPTSALLKFKISGLAWQFSSYDLSIVDNQLLPNGSSTDRFSMSASRTINTELSFPGSVGRTNVMVFTARGSASFLNGIALPESTNYFNGSAAELGDGFIISRDPISGARWDINIRIDSRSISISR